MNNVDENVTPISDIKIGSNLANGLRLGSNPVLSARLGSNNVYSAYNNKTVVNQEYIDVDDIKQDSNTISLNIDGNCTQNGTPTPSSPINIKTIEGCINLFDKSQYTRDWRTTINTITELPSGLRVKCKQSGTQRYSIIPLPNPSKLLGKQVTIKSIVTVSGSNTSTMGLYFINEASHTYYNTAIVTTGNMTNANGAKSVTGTIPSSFPNGYNGIGLFLYSTGSVSTSVGSYVDYEELRINYGPDLPKPYTPYGRFIPVYIKNKNLLELKRPENNTNKNGITTIINGNQLSISGKSTAVWANLTIKNFYRLCAGTYTFSTDVADNFQKIIRCSYSDNTSFDLTIPKNEKSVTYTFSEDFFCTYIYVGGLTTGTTYNNTFKLQLEKGSTATEIVNNQSQEFFIPVQNDVFGKVGSAKDEIKISNTSKKLIKRIGKIESYNGESVGSNYISTTGALTNGATVYYELAQSTETTLDISNIQYYNGINSIVIADDGEAEPSLLSYGYYVD